MSNVTILKDAEGCKMFLDAVIAASNANTRALGFLPKSVFREALALGRLWILGCHDRYAGHLLFGGALPTLQVKQLYVTREMRRRGLARRLIEDLVCYGEVNGYSAIRAKVAADLEANAIWDSLGFSTKGVELGGATTGRFINKRYRQLTPRGSQEHWHQLFDAHARTSGLVARGMPINRDHWYTIDLNIWLDFSRKRQPFYEAVSQLIREATRGQFRLRFTTEAQEEARRTSQGRTDDPLLSVAKTWQAVPEEDGPALQRLVNELRSLVFPQRSGSSLKSANDTSDLRHLAMSIRAGSSGFLTREKAILRRRTAIWQKFDFRVLTPDDLLDSYEPRIAPLTSLHGDLRVQKIHEQWHGVAELIARARSDGARLRMLDREDQGWFCSVREQIVGIAFWRRTHQNDVEAFLMLDDSLEINDDTRQRVFDILLGLLSAEAHSVQMLHRLLLGVDIATSGQYSNNLKRLGFFGTSEPDQFVRFACSSPLLLEDWEQAAAKVEKELGVTSDWLGPDQSGPVLRLQKGETWHELDLFDFETRFGITGLTLHNRRAFYVPIKEKYANELLPRARRPELFRDNDAAFRVERVYFKSPRQTAGLRPGDLLFFYISSPISAVVGLARCTVSKLLAPTAAFEQFRRLAVLDPHDVDHPQVHCIAFDSYIHFPTAVRFKWLDQKALVPPQNFISLVRVPDTGNYAEIVAEGLQKES